MASTELRKAADKVDDAYQSYAHDNGGDGEGPDWHNAYEYREDGYFIGEQAFALPDDENAREYHIEAALNAYPETAQYLVAVAANYRLAELIDNDRYAFKADAPAQRVAA